jgi:hypothetical protein
MPTIGNHIDRIGVGPVALARLDKGFGLVAIITASHGWDKGHSMIGAGLVRVIDASSRSPLMHD